MNIVNLFKNNLSRILNQRAVVIVGLIVVPIFIGAGILFSTKTHMTLHIALITEKAQKLPTNNLIKIDVMKKKPPLSQLLLGKYAGIVEEKVDGVYVVTAIKSKADKVSIEQFFNTGKIIDTQSKDNKRGTGTSILGFIVMIILMQGMALSTIYPEDRTLKTLKRVLTAPVSEKLYLFVLGGFVFLCIFIPTYAAIIITKVIFGINIGFNPLIMALLVGVLSAISTAFALFFTSAFENSSLAATGIYVITCVLGGCFYSFKGSNKVFNNICSILPQKAYLTLAQGLENGKKMLELRGQLIYLFAWIVGLWLIGSVITKEKLKKGIF